ncbi:hypothetical protein HMPREF1982_00386 [Clostridiales bacterium oral taxon 876 str. F0540]|nr:hypothetical protein HMPREF1982_00386 [Clostridiales bacterium oral taxon 876 str. F0540]
MQSIIVWCADIGSIKNRRFGWCRAVLGSNKSGSCGISIEDFATGIAEDLSNGYRVALGFECPLFVPVPDNPLYLTSEREGEGDRAWSTGAGCGALATGLTECVWILNMVKELVKIDIKVTFDWDEFINKPLNIFIWEAFVSKSSKSLTHHGDAEIAVKSFISKYPNIVQANAIKVDNPYNLVAAALLRADISDNINLLSQACLVIKG